MKLAAIAISTALLLTVTGCTKDVYADELAKCLTENREEYEQSEVFVSKEHANEVLTKACEELATKKQQDAK